MPVFSDHCLQCFYPEPMSSISKLKAIAHRQPCLGLYPPLVFRVISFPLEHYGTSLQDAAKRTRRKSKRWRVGYHGLQTQILPATQSRSELQYSERGMSHVSPRMTILLGQQNHIRAHQP